MAGSRRLVMTKPAARLGLLLVVAGAWQVLAVLKQSPLIPSIPAIARGLAMAITGAWDDVLASLSYLLAAALMAILAGIIAGTIFYQFAEVRELIAPLFDGIRSLSVLTLFPLFIIAFGIGFASKAAVIFFAAFPTATLMTLAALTSADPELREAAALDGATQAQALFAVLLPAVAGSLLVGVKAAIGVAWVALTAAEMLGATRGMGYLVLVNTQTFNFADAYAVILLIAMTGVSANYIMDRIIASLER